MFPSYEYLPTIMWRGKPILGRSCLDKHERPNSLLSGTFGSSALLFDKAHNSIIENINIMQLLVALVNRGKGPERLASQKKLLNEGWGIVLSYHRWCPLKEVASGTRY